MLFEEFEDDLCMEPELPEPEDDIDEGGGFIDLFLWLIHIFSH